MLSVVGMLNYMGNHEVPICTSLDEKFADQMPAEQFRVAKVSEAKNELQAEQFADEDWSLNINGLDDLRQNYEELGFSGDLVPARPSQLRN